MGCPQPQGVPCPVPGWPRCPIPCAPSSGWKSGRACWLGQSSPPIKRRGAANLKPAPGAPWGGVGAFCVALVVPDPTPVTPGFTLIWKPVSPEPLPPVGGIGAVLKGLAFNLLSKSAAWRVLSSRASNSGSVRRAPCHQASAKRTASFRAFTFRSAPLPNQILSKCFDGVESRASRQSSKRVTAL